MQDNLQLDQAELFRVAIEQSPTAMTIQDEQHRLVVVNRAYCDLIGYSQDEVLGKDPIEFALASNNSDAALQHREQVMELPAQGGPVRFTIYRELIHRDGRRIPVRLEVAMAYARDNSRRWCTWAFDLSGQQQAIKAIEKRHDLIVLEAHHRIKNNLHGLAGLIESRVLTNPQLEKPLGEVANWLGMVGDIHGLKFEQDGQVELVEMVKAAVSGVSTLFDVDIPVSMPEPVSDKSFVLSEDHTLSFALVVNELLTNACKHTEHSPPSVLISTHRTGVQVTISNPGLLPGGFSLKDQSTLGSGLSLLTGLIPKSGMTVDLSCHDEIVTATVVLTKPILIEPSKAQA